MKLKCKLAPILNYFLPILIAGIFAYGLWAQHFDRLIPILQTKRSSIATISKFDGLVNYRYAQDTIWLPARKGQKLYDGDFIQTESDSKLTINLIEKENKKNQLIVMPDSFIRIFFKNSRFLIEMHSGSLETDFEIPQTIRVKNGLMESTLPLPKARVKINITKQSNDKASSIQVDQIQEQKPNSNSATSNDQPNEEDDSEPQNDNKVVRNKVKGSPNFETYPKSGTYLFYKSLQDINFLPRSKCVGECQLAISFGGNLFFNKKIESGKLDKILISQQEYINDRQGKFTWKFYDSKSDPQLLEGEFWVFPYTDDNFAEALKIGAPVEFIN
ncbi:MAG: hypothetical protein MK008_12835 [Bdellovibrionales bacterium]|nr:hypothetical protein [Bdellovibrionales bacterium]